MCTHIAEGLGSLDYGAVHTTAQATVRSDGHDHVRHVSSCHLVVGRRRDLLGDTRHGVSKRARLFSIQPWRGRRDSTQGSRQTNEGRQVENDIECNQWIIMSLVFSLEVMTALACPPWLSITSLQYKSHLRITMSWSPEESKKDGALTSSCNCDNSESV